MRVLIIGGTRFVGYFLAWRLSAGGHRVTLLNRGSTPDPFGSRVERVRADRRTPEGLAALDGRSFDAIVDFAAYLPGEVDALIEVFRGRVGHYVMISTGQVYLVLEQCPRPALEEHYAGRLTPQPEGRYDADEWSYGVGKRGCEDALVAAWERERFPSTRLRLPMIHGERDHFRRIESYLWRILDGGPLLVPRPPDPPMRHVYGGAVATAIASLLGNPATHGEVYNLAQSETVSLPELLSKLCELVGAPLRLVRVADEDLAGAGLDRLRVSPLSGRWMSLLDPGKAQRELGLAHPSLDEYLARIVTTFLAHPPQAPPPGYEARAEELSLASRLSSPAEWHE